MDQRAACMPGTSTVLLVRKRSHHVDGFTPYLFNRAAIRLIGEGVTEDCR